MYRQPATVPTLGAVGTVIVRSICYFASLPVLDFIVNKDV